MISLHRPDATTHVTPTRPQTPARRASPNHARHRLDTEHPLLGTVSLPKTANPAHVRSNAEVDFVISEEDMAALRDLRAQDYGERSVFPVYSGK